RRAWCAPTPTPPPASSCWPASHERRPAVRSPEARPVSAQESMGLPRRRAVLQAGTLVLLLGSAQIARGAKVVAVRLWPAEDYTRVTIESDAALATRSFMVSQPPRLAI